jgi:hypothetical protein
MIPICYRKKSRKIYQQNIKLPHSSINVCYVLKFIYKFTMWLFGGFVNGLNEIFFFRTPWMNWLLYAIVFQSMSRDKFIFDGYDDFYIDIYYLMSIKICDKQSVDWILERGIPLITVYIVLKRFSASSSIKFMCVR